MEEEITIHGIWQMLRPSRVFNTRGRWERCCKEWNMMDKAQQERIYRIIQAKRQNGEKINPNPLFAFLDAMQEDEVKQSKVKQPDPTNYNGRALPDEPTATAFYNGKWGIYTVKEIEKYGLRTPVSQTGQ